MAALDYFGGAEQVTDPADNIAPVTPNDGTDLTAVTRALIVSVGGTLKVSLRDGSAVTVTVPAGVLPIRVARVWATGTTATGITALW